MKAVLGGGLLNDPVGLTLLIFGIVVVAVAIILYFFVFKKKIDAKLADNKVKRAQNEVKDAKAQTLAGDVFKEEEQRVNKKMTEEELAAFEQKYKTVVSEKKSANTNERNFNAQVDIEKPKKDDAPKDNEPDSAGFNVMNQFGKKN